MRYRHRYGIRIVFATGMLSSSAYLGSLSSRYRDRTVHRLDRGYCIVSSLPGSLAINRYRDRYRHRYGIAIIIATGSAMYRVQGSLVVIAFGSLVSVISYRDSLPGIATYR
ncbi:hypothetical protein Tco_0639023 [Tanacetum coccineum]